MAQPVKTLDVQFMQPKARHHRHARALCGIALVSMLSLAAAPATAEESIDDLWGMTIAAANSIVAQAQANSDKKAMRLIVDEVQGCMTRVNDALASHSKPDDIVRECARKISSDVCTGRGFADTSTAASIKSTPACEDLADSIQM
jgi:hypothetical protein